MLRDDKKISWYDLPSTPCNTFHIQHTLPVRAKAEWLTTIGHRARFPYCNAMCHNASALTGRANQSAGQIVPSYFFTVTSNVAPPRGCTGWSSF